jgi:hypothetical protein
MKLSLFTAAIVFCGSNFSSQAAVSVTSVGFTYTQNFDTLTQTVGSVAWANDATLQGWHLFTGATVPAPLTTYSAGTGSSLTGNIYSFGSSASPTDRALGAVASGSSYFGSPATGTTAAYMAVSLTNNSGAALNRIQFSYSGEQWRDSGAAAAQGITLQYGFGTTFSSVSTWTAPGGAFSWTGPLATGTTGPVDGNTVGLVANRGGTLTGLPWNIGTTLWLRWADINDPNEDHGLAIDNFKVLGVPEPAAFFIGALGLLRLLIRRR